MSLFTGFQELTITGSFPAILMYPTPTPSTPITRGPYTLEVAENAVVENGRFPLVMISHGSGGSPIAHRTLMMFLAKNGYIVCAIEHPFNNRRNNEHEDTLENLIYRPQHVRQAIDSLLSDPNWSSSIQEDKIAVVGHSIGAYTALALAGGVPHTQHQMAYDPHCKITSSQEVPVLPDFRIRALVLLAPAAGWFLSPGALSEVHLPILIFSAEHDDITPLLHAKIVHDGVPSSDQITHEIVKNAGHFSFLSSFPEKMRNSKFMPSMDPEGFDRESFHTHMNAEIRRFLKNLFS
jgi:predicted dienelactone hydrolase